ncbi:HPr kinase/phosphorylase, partial [Bordetella holmesii]|nr:HPr kinase/phosphorylase [Bordetella holmesii]
MLTVQELVDDNADKIPCNSIAAHGAADRAIPEHGMAEAALVGDL